MRERNVLWTNRYLGLNNALLTLIRRKSGKPWLTSRSLTVTGLAFKPCKPAMVESTEKSMFVKERVPTAVLASALADPESLTVSCEFIVVAAKKFSKVE